MKTGIGGLEDMKHIYGTTVARKKGKAGKEGKVGNLEVKAKHTYSFQWLLKLQSFSVYLTNFVMY